MHNLLLLFLSLVACMSAFAQSPQGTCGMEFIHDDRLYTDPGYDQKVRKFDEWVMRAIMRERNNSSRGADTAVFTIPVVYHILHQNGAENIPDARVYQELNNLNDAFRNVGFYDQGRGVDMHVEFCLATVAPDGFPTSGIEHIETPYAIISTAQENAEMRRTFNWDPNRYLNVYTARSISFGGAGIILGVAIFPSDAGEPEDGITMMASLVGVPTDPRESTVMAHEVGHYMGLYHTFQGRCGNNDCMLQGDRVCDTPPDHDSVLREGCIMHNNCTSDADDPRSINPFTTDVPDMNNNYMDYNAGHCQNAFTQGQRERVRAVIRNLRSGLLTSAVCRIPSPYDAGITAIENPPLTICSPNFFPQVTLTNFGLAPLTSTAINFQIDGGPIYTENWTGNVSYTQSTAIALSGQTVSPGPHILTVYTSSASGQIDANSDNDTLRIPFYYTPETVLPLQEGFEQGIPDSWALYNPEGNSWEDAPYGCDSMLGDARCAMLDNSLFYAAGYEDGLITPIIDLTGAVDPAMNFDVAFGFRTNGGNASDRLLVQVSLDCGATFLESSLYNKRRNDLATANINNDTVAKWVPTDCNDWRRETVDLRAFIGQKIMLRFLYSKSRNGFPIYIDNVNIGNGIAASISPNALPQTAFRFYPNPATDGFYVESQWTSPLTGQITVADMMGRIVWKEEIHTSGRSWRTFIKLSTAHTGIYFITIETAEERMSSKVVVRK